MKKEVLIMSGHASILKVSVVIDVIDDKALFFGMSVSPDFSEHFRGLSGEHGTVDDFDETSLLRHEFDLMLKLISEGNILLNLKWGKSTYVFRQWIVNLDY